MPLWRRLPGSVANAELLLAFRTELHGISRPAALDRALWSPWRLSRSCSSARLALWCRRFWCFDCFARKCRRVVGDFTWIEYGGASAALAFNNALSDLHFLYMRKSGRQQALSPQWMAPQCRGSSCFRRLRAGFYQKLASFPSKVPMRNQEIPQLNSTRRLTGSARGAIHRNCSGGLELRSSRFAAKKILPGAHSHPVTSRFWMQNPQIATKAKFRAWVQWKAVSE